MPTVTRNRRAEVVARVWLLAEDPPPLEEIAKRAGVNPEELLTAIRDQIPEEPWTPSPEMTKAERRAFFKEMAEWNEKNPPPPPPADPQGRHP
jgi:hypothetical protein